MGKNINISSKLKVIGISAIAFGLFFSNSTLATTDDVQVKYSSKYEELLKLSDEEITDLYVSNDDTADLPDEVVKEFSKINIPSLLDEVRNRKDSFSLESMSASYTDKTYNLNNDAKVKVKNQGTTNECWAFAAISSLETNVSLTEQLKEAITYSPRHMDYATSRTFADGENTIGFGRELGEGGIPNVAFAYLSNGTGAVLESDMPFENNENKISLSEIEKTVSRVVTQYEVLPTINKKYDTEGNVTYYDANGKQYTEASLTNARNIIKQHIIKYGAVASTTAANEAEYYNNPTNIATSTAYFCNKEVTRDHAITIVGWDDNYSASNFNSENRPKTNGAYIVLNSYGTGVLDNGYYYISYEDYLIEDTLFGVMSSSEVDYDNIYQNDFYGGYLEIGAANQDTGYIASIYDRDSSKTEMLNSIGITSTEYANYEIYVNANGDSLDSNSLTKIGETGLIAPGYVKVDVKSTKLTGSKFAIVVKQKSTEGTGFFFPIEVNIPDTVYNYVSAATGNSKISLDGTNWLTLNSLTGITVVDMSTADTCLKAFTTEITEEKPSTDENQNEMIQDTITSENPKDETNSNQDEVNTDKITEDNKNDNTEEDKNQEELKVISEYYKIEDEYISKVEFATSIENFKKNITTNSSTIDFYTANNEKITDTSKILATGMKVKFENEKTYTIIVRGDLNCDGNISLTDLSKIIAHYNELKGFELTGNSLRAADLNYDGKVTLTDVSQLMVIFSNL
jgi:C1A family cysteine protease